MGSFAKPKDDTHFDDAKALIRMLHYMELEAERVFRDDVALSALRMAILRYRQVFALSDRDLYRPDLPNDGAEQAGIEPPLADSPGRKFVAA